MIPMFVSVLTLIVLQVVVRKGRLTAPWFWTAVDYVWVAGTTITLLSYAVESDQRAVTDRLQQQRATIEEHARFIRYRASFEATMISTMIQHASAPDMRRRMEHDLPWFGSLADALHGHIEERRWIRFLECNDLLGLTVRAGEQPSRYGCQRAGWRTIVLSPEDSTDYTLQRARELVPKLRELDIELLDLERESERRSFLTLSLPSVKIVWPWVLCVSLALRLTKVTVDARNRRKTTPAQGTDDSSSVGVPGRTGAADRKSSDGADVVGETAAGPTA